MKLHGSDHRILWTIGGSDCSGGAGVQADILTAASLGVHCCPVLSSVTAQNSVRVVGRSSSRASLLREQIEALLIEFPPSAIKIGMIGDLDAVEVLASTLRHFKVPVVLDPVFYASSGGPLVDPEVIEKIRTDLLPWVTVLTPNLLEVEKLVGFPIEGRRQEASKHLLSLGVQAVVIKGGHASTKEECTDSYSTLDEWILLKSPRHKGPSPRGTGCTFATALASALACGYSTLDATVIAKMAINGSLRSAKRVGESMTVLGHPSWNPVAEDLPRLISSSFPNVYFEFPRMESPGFYPIVDRALWLERLLPLGVRTIQLRIKDLVGSELESEIHRSVEIARRHSCQLFVNDYWELALKHKAYGIHLGQEDLDTADLGAISKAGVRLGISTHCFSEMTRAHAFRPSYMAIGPVFPTTLKSMRFRPIGTEVLRQWKSFLDYPVVAIGGISLEKAPEVTASGVEGIAVVSDITQNSNPEARAQSWLRYFETLGV
jgi:hydroxymethylpyrimidine kinase / phosphomethylpyrimidine kinase / thiamine-phosphate diphosphorylase